MSVQERTTQATAATGSPPTPSREQGRLLPLLYDSDRTYGWNEGMAALVVTLLRRLALPANPRLLEIGCGAGTTLRAVALAFPQAEIQGIDLHPHALMLARGHHSAAPMVMQSDLHHLPLPAQSYDAVLALDTFDQNTVDLPAALMESLRILRPHGVLLVRVSAYPWLQSAHDVAFNTGRRFTAAALRRVLCEGGFEFLSMTHANTLLALPVIALRLWQRWSDTSLGEGIYQSHLANRALRLALAQENWWLRNHTLPFGLSLMAVARPNNGKRQ